MLDEVDWLVVTFVAAQAIVLAVVAVIAIERGRDLETIAGSLADDAEAASPDGGGLRGRAADAVERVRRLRRRAEAAETAADQRVRDLAYLADLVGVGIIRLSDDLRVELANRAAHVFLARPAGSMVGRTAIEAIGDDRIEAIVRAALASGSVNDEVERPGPDGATLLVRARRSPVLGIWVVLEDVAELRRLQRIRAEFIDNLSHELRTPITTVGLLAETLARDADAAGDAVPEKMRERIAKLEVETGHIGQMVAELLDLARIESGGRQVHLDDVDLAKVAVESVERLRPFADRQGIELTVDVPDACPRVRGEGDRLAQVFANLIHNAVKFSHAGGTVRVTVRVGEGVLVASVADDGVGIAAADLPRVFERFYKADRARVRAGGTGLGLAIARHVVEGHGGAISAESREGAGSTFTFTLPLPSV